MVTFGSLKPILTTFYFLLSKKPLHMNVTDGRNIALGTVTLFRLGKSWGRCVIVYVQLYVPHARCEAGYGGETSNWVMFLQFSLGLCFSVPSIRLPGNENRKIVHPACTPDRSSTTWKMDRTHWRLPGPYTTSRAAHTRSSPILAFVGASAHPGATHAPLNRSATHAATAPCSHRSSLNAPMPRLAARTHSKACAPCYTHPCPPFPSSLLVPHTSLYRISIPRRKRLSSVSASPVRPCSVRDRREHAGAMLWRELQGAPAAHARARTHVHVPLAPAPRPQGDCSRLSRSRTHRSAHYSPPPLPPPRAPAALRRTGEQSGAASRRGSARAACARRARSGVYAPQPPPPLILSRRPRRHAHRHTLQSPWRQA